MEPYLLNAYNNQLNLQSHHLQIIHSIQYCCLSFHIVRITVCDNVDRG